MHFSFLLGVVHALLHARPRHFSPCGQSPVRVPSASCVNHRLQRVEKTRHRCEGEKMSEGRKVVQAHKPKETPVSALIFLFMRAVHVKGINIPVADLSYDRNFARCQVFLCNMYI